MFHSLAARSVAVPNLYLPKVRELTIQTQTPLRIRRNGVLLETIDFPTIIRNITNRIKTLTTRYGGWSDAEEILHIQNLSTKISIANNHLTMQLMQRYSNRLQEKMSFNGLMGTMQFTGELTPFVPWLNAAQILHIGRNTTFGMGAVDVEFL